MEDHSWTDSHGKRERERKRRKKERERGREREREEEGEGPRMGIEPPVPPDGKNSSGIGLAWKDWRSR